MKRPAAALALAACAACAACALGQPQVDGAGAAPCAQNAECAAGNVCFLGECRGQAALLGAVEVEVRPPNDAPYATLQRSAVDLRQSVLNDFQLASGATFGSVLQEQDAIGGVTPPAAPIAGAALAFYGTFAVIPGRTPEVEVRTGQTGAFSARLPQGGAPTLPWQISVLSPDGGQPPLYLAQALPPGGPPLVLVLPAPGRLLSRAGKVTAGGVPLAGATVLAVDAAQDGRPLSLPVITDASGSFTLTLPPSPQPLWLRIGGTAHTAPGLPPVPSFAAVGPFGTADAPGAALDALPAPASVSGTVLDSTGAPLAGALVNALSVDPTSWVLSASAQTDATGAFTLALRAGNYALKAAPGGSAGAALSDEIPIVAVDGATLAPIVCPAPVVAQGTLLRPGGGSVGAGTQITAARMPDRLFSRRYAQVTPTDGAGRFTIAGDAGDYRVEFVPPPASGLPRKIVSLTLARGVQALAPVVLSPPLEAVGTVTGPSPAFAPVPGAVIDFFALDSSAAHAVRIGSGVADANGHYRAILPDVTSPGL